MGTAVRSKTVLGVDFARPWTPFCEDWILFCGQYDLEPALSFFFLILMLIQDHYKNFGKYIKLQRRKCYLSDTVT